MAASTTGGASSSSRWERSRSTAPGSANCAPRRRAENERRRSARARWLHCGPAVAAVDPGARRRALAELLLERYGVLTREQVLAEGIAGGFSAIYAELTQLETLGIARRGYFVEGRGGAQFALPGAVERLRAQAPAHEAPVVLAAVDPAQPYGAALPWPKRDIQERRPSRVAGAYVVLVADEPVLYVERGGRSLLTFAGASPSAGRGEAGSLEHGLRALAEAVRAGRVPKLALERIDGEAATGSALAATLLERGFHSGPRRLTLSA